MPAFDRPQALVDGGYLRGSPVSVGAWTAVADMGAAWRVAWWHYCTAIYGDGTVTGWVPAGLVGHTITGTVADGNLTVTPSIRCGKCGTHGYITAMEWRDA